MARRTVLTEEKALRVTADTRDLNSPLIVRRQSGGNRFYTVRVRINGKSKRFTLGKVGVVNFNDAQTRARAYQEAAQRGEDYSLVEKQQEKERQEKQAKLATETYPAVVSEYLESFAKKRQRTWRQTELILNSMPWEDRPIRSITKGDAAAELRELVSAGKNSMAALKLRHLKSLWRWSWRMDLVDAPAMDALRIADFGVVKKVRNRVFSEAEIKALWNMTGNVSSQERAYVKLLLLFGVRKSELLGMRKEELDDPENPTLWTIPTERTKTSLSREHEGRVYLVPIPPLARRVLKPLLKGNGELVFPGRIKGRPMDCGTPLMKRIREASGVEDWCAHTWRHTVTTWFQNHGHDEFDRGLVLNHAGSSTVTAGYSHGYAIDRKRELLEKWADHVSAVAGPEGAALLA